MKNDVCVKIDGDYGLVIRRAALAERNIALEKILSIVEMKVASDESNALIVFSPIFGSEALQQLSARFMHLGLSYFDDFFEYAGHVPTWCKAAFLEEAA